MVGYPESLTDPSYRGQILTLTSPMVGNYGVPDRTVKDEFGLPKFFESDEIHVAGLLVQDYSFHYSHWNAVSSLGDWMKEQGVPGISGIDTRMITKKIRDKGAMKGRIEIDLDAPVPDFPRWSMSTLVIWSTRSAARRNRSLVKEIQPKSLPSIVV